MQPRLCRFQSRNRDSCHFRTAARFVHRGDMQSFNLAIEILVISGYPASYRHRRHQRVSISQSRFLSFQGRPAILVYLWMTMVSISQSRFLSFQAALVRNLPCGIEKFQSRNRDSCHFRVAAFAAGIVKLGFQSRNRDSCHFRTTKPTDAIISAEMRFNLAIEILVISGYLDNNLVRVLSCLVSISQSRFLSFQVARGGELRIPLHEFQSRNRDSCHFRLAGCEFGAGFVLKFQSRNRDSCHFRFWLQKTHLRRFVMFQSRNRDSCHFRIGGLPTWRECLPRFNLAIEILVISGHGRHRQSGAGGSDVSISQSRFLSFQEVFLYLKNRFHAFGSDVSISQSRFLSFQAVDPCLCRTDDILVSISQSRFLSFQVS